MSRRYAYDGNRTSLGAGNGTRSQLYPRWSRTAYSGSALGQGDPTVLTWSYVPDGTTIGSHAGEGPGQSQLFSWLNQHYPGGFEEWHPLFEQTFKRWGELTGVHYIYEPSDDGANFPSARGIIGVRGDVRISAKNIDGNSGILAYNFYPNTGDMVIDAFDSYLGNKFDNSRTLRNVIGHEHGHGLGLRHVCPVNGTKLMEPYASISYDGPQHDDILGAQQHYGDPFENDDSAIESWLIQPGDTIVNKSIDSATDEDWFRITTDAGQLVNLTVSPIGESYLESPQTSTCYTGDLVDTTGLRDLGFELIQEDGSGVYSSTDSRLAGQNEYLSMTSPKAGDYFIRVFGDSGEETQLYSLSFSSDRNSPIFMTSDFEHNLLIQWDIGYDTAEDNR
jgi:hypothetical protein